MNKLPKLSERLRAIADLVPNGSTVADIGTDHAYIPVYLTNSGISKFAIASDVKKGPILRAEATINEFGAKNRVETRIGNGLKNIKCGEADTVIIAGMGGILISNILDNSKEVLSGIETLILQPMTAVYELRKYLYENEYTISDEILVKEDNKLYTIIKAVHGKDNVQSELQLRIGKKLIEKNDELLTELLNRHIKKLSEQIGGLSLSAITEERQKKINSLKILLSEIRNLKNNII